jgi:hypothetical protein
MSKPIPALSSADGPTFIEALMQMGAAVLEISVADRAIVAARAGVFCGENASIINGDIADAARRLKLAEAAIKRARDEIKKLTREGGGK